MEFSGEINIIGIMLCLFVVFCGMGVLLLRRGKMQRWKDPVENEYKAWQRWRRGKARVGTKSQSGNKMPMLLRRWRLRSLRNWRTKCRTFRVSEVMPEYPGGEEAMLRYLRSIKYPVLARENNIGGAVDVRFVVGKTGKVENVEIATGSHRRLNAAALRHIRKMPRWKPGTQNGKAVSVQFIVPMRFIPGVN